VAQLRVLVCGDFSSLTLPHSRQCADALEELGCDVLRVDSEDRRRKLPEMLKRWSKSLAKRIGLKQRLSDFYVRRELASRNGRVKAAFDRHRPELVLVIRGNAIDESLLEEMRKRGARLVGWWIKDVRRPENLSKDLPHYDAYYCIHRNLCQEGVRYLPAWSVDRRRYYPAEEPAYRHDVVFVGIWNPKRQSYLDLLTGYNLGLVGPGWSTRTLASNPALARHVVKNTLHGEELTRFYQSARIVLNINQWESNEASGTTLRVADVPACGSFLLTEYSGGLEDLFELGTEICIFTTPDEMKEKIDYFLKHAGERERIARAGLERARSLPTPKDRMEQLLSEIYHPIAQ
jgi:spore maturation protein CgeB